MSSKGKKAAKRRRMDFVEPSNVGREVYIGTFSKGEFSHRQSLGSDCRSSALLILE